MAEFLNAYLQIEGMAELKEYVLKNGVCRSYEKGEYFLRQGESGLLAGYIQSGGFRYTAYTTKGDEQTIGYSFADDFVADYGAFCLQIPSVANVCALKDSAVYLISQQDFIEFCAQCTIPDFRTRLADSFLVDIYSRLLSLYCDTPEERYLNLVNRYPEILNKVSLREIASFIKVTPETLSRIRKKITLFSKP